MMMNKWANDPLLVHLMRPNPSKEDLEKKMLITAKTLTERLEKSDQIYLIYAAGALVGEMSFQVDPQHLLKDEKGSAWIGIGIGEVSARGQGVGGQAMRYLEEEIRVQGLKRIELGVFEFNANAIKLYKKMGYKEIARIDNFTYWQGKMWQDIRMEKRLYE